jgi:hypothetical protein
LAAIRETGVTEYFAESSRSLRLDVGGPDHLAPLLGFVGDELTEIGGREREHLATEIGKPRLDFGIGEAGIDLPVELVNNVGGGPGKNSAIVGTPGSVSERVAVVTASARSLSALIYSIDATVPGNMTCTCPPSRSVNAGPPPR